MNWHILDPLGGEDWVKFMCSVTEFSYITPLTPHVDERVSLIIPDKYDKLQIMTGPEYLNPSKKNWYVIYYTSTKSSPYISIDRETILPQQAELAVRHFELLTGLTLTF